MPHVNQLIDEFGSKGLAVVGVTNEAEEPTMKFVEATEAKFAVAFVKGAKTNQAYGVRGIPAAFLVDPDGKVVWKGHPAGLSGKDIEPHLRKVRAAVELPKKFAPIERLLASEKYGQAHERTTRGLEKEDLAEEDREALGKAKAWIEERAREAEAETKRLEEERDYAAAEEALARTANHFDGMEAAARAREALERYRSDESIRKELEAARKVADAEKRVRAKDFRGAYRAYESVEKSYPGTGAAERAGRLKARLEADGWLAYNPRCRACKRAGAACEECKAGSR